MTEWTSFDVHGLLSVRVNRAAPAEPQLRLMLAPFEVDQSKVTPVVTVTGRPVSPTAAAHAETAYRYDAGGVYLPWATVTRTQDGWRVSGRGELLTAVLPLIDRLCLAGHAAMVHAATLDIGGRGVCLASWGGVGKTSTVARLMRLPDVRFMGDDWAFVSSSGELLSWPKPLFLKAHHRPLYPQVFRTLRKPLVPRQLTRPLGGVATAVHPLVARYPRLAAVTRRWSPEHHIIPADEVFRDRITARVPLAGLAFVERYGGARAMFHEVPSEELLARLVGNFHAELPRQSRDLITALGATGLLGMQDYFAGKADVLAAAVRTCPTGLIRIPVRWSARDAAEAIADLVLGRFGITAGAA